MSKFNLVKYQKNSVHDHIDQRLKKEHSDAPDSITEKQLNKDRVPAKDFTTEMQLEKVRKGSSETIIEKRLNDSKGGLHKHRNPTAHKGDINKVEEQRLAGKPVEKEKYEAASSTSKKKRWWENIKKASSKQTVKLAKDDSIDELDFEKPHFDEAVKQWNEEEGITPGSDAQIMSNIDVPEEELDAEESLSMGEITVRKNQQTEAPMASVYMSLGYDVMAYNGDVESIKQDVLDKVLEIRPYLADKISVNDIGSPREKNGEGIVDVRLWGEEYLKDDNPDEQSMFTEVSFDETDVGGTPMYMGVIKINVDPEMVEEKDILGFIEVEHPGIDVKLDNIDFSKLIEGEVSYVVANNNTPLEPDGSGSGSIAVDNVEDFSIEEDDAVGDVLDIGDEDANVQASTNFGITVFSKKK